MDLYFRFGEVSSMNHGKSDKGKETESLLMQNNCRGSVDAPPIAIRNIFSDVPTATKVVVIEDNKYRSWEKK